MNRLMVELIVVVALLSAFTLYERRAGAQNCIRADLIAEAHQETHNAVTAALAIQTVQFEKNAYVEAKLVPIPRSDVPSVTCVRNSPATAVVPAADPARSVDHGDGGLSTRDRGSVPATTDISLAAAGVGRDANAQVKQLKDYIMNVCLAVR